LTVLLLPETRCCTAECDFRLAAFFPSTRFPDILPFRSVTGHLLRLILACSSKYFQIRLSILRRENCLIKLDVVIKSKTAMHIHLLFTTAVQSKYKPYLCSANICRKWFLIHCPALHYRPVQRHRSRRSSYRQQYLSFSAPSFSFCQPLGFQ